MRTEQQLTIAQGITEAIASDLTFIAEGLDIIGHERVPGTVIANVIERLNENAEKLRTLPPF